MTCPQCHHPLRDDARFCTRCGYNTAERPSTSTTSDPTSPTERLELDTNENQAAAKTIVDPLIGHRLDGKYELMGRLGEGGMGAVYRARRTHIGDEVAVKVLHPRFVDDESSLERFRREARAAAQLHHRNVVTIHDYGEAHEQRDAPAYIVMELVDGTSLRELLKRKGRLPVAEAVKLMRDICAGVSAAHRRGIIHRDLKPDNVIVTPDSDNEGEETAKVVDFGIAKLRDKTSDATLTQAGMVVGTPFYMSPEQCRGESLDARADVYSLGAMLYEMIAGRPPFIAQHVTGVVAKHLTEPPPPLPPELNVPPALQTVIMRALAKNPNDRPADAAAFARELQTAMDETVVAPRQTSNPDTAPQNIQPTNAALPLVSNPISQPVAQPNYQSAEYRTPETIARAQTPPPTQYQSYQVNNQTAARRSSRGGWWLLGLGVIIFFGALAAIASYLLLASRANNANERVENRPNARLSPSPSSSLRPSATPTPEAMLPFERAENKILSGALLTNADLSGVAPNELRFLRNAVYARHGRAFNDADLQRYFSSRPWYKPNANYSDTQLTANDRANVNLIKSIEDSAKPLNTPTPASPAEIAAARQAVSGVINDWVNSANQRDANAQMSHYADVVGTYYRKANVPASEIRAERARVYARYSDINLRVTNLNIEVDPTATMATATFDKTWDFTGEKHSTGSVRQELILKKINNDWRIVGERDLKVYYSSSGLNIPDSSEP